MDVRSVVVKAGMSAAVAIMLVFGVGAYVNDTRAANEAPGEAEMARSQLQSVRQEMASVSSDIESSERKVAAAQGLLKPIRIINARYYWTRSGFLDTATVALTITNGGHTAIKRIYLHGILRSRGREIPWVDDDLNYQFDGGLEPGETQELALEPNMFGSWSAEGTKGRDDLELSLKVLNFEGADGKPVLDVDASDLAGKRAQLAELQKSATELDNKVKRSSPWW